MRFAQKVRKKIKQHPAEFYSLRSMLGYDWALFLLLLGGREAGKSYSVTEFYVRQWKIYGRPFYWMRLTDASQEKLLKNNAERAKKIISEFKPLFNSKEEYFAYLSGTLSSFSI